LVPEGLSASEVGKEISEHHERATEKHAGGEHLISIIEAVLLSVVALMAAWSGYAAAKWDTRASVSLANALSTRTDASLAEIQASQLRTQDSVSLSAVETAYAANNAKLYHIAVNRLRAGYRPAFEAWLATHPFANAGAPPDPTDMPQYRIPEQAQGQALTARSVTYFMEGQAAAGTADKYVRLTVVLAAVLFLVGIGSRFRVRAARLGLIAVAGVLLVISVVQLAGLPGPPS
jgi:hypothetical protein